MSDEQQKIDDTLTVDALMAPTETLAADAPCTIEGAESAGVSFPEFFGMLREITG